VKLQEYHAYLEGLPLPTAAQFDEFAQHVAEAHSWYKHLDLVRGAEVVVFLDPRAGGAFDERQPRLHHTWKTREEYLRRFGHLAYMWRHGDVPDLEFDIDYARNRIEPGPDGRTVIKTDKAPKDDGMPVLSLPREIMEQCSFRMYPFACDNHVVLRRFEKALKATPPGTLQYPCQDLLVDALRARKATLHAYIILEEMYPQRTTVDPESMRLHRSCFTEISRERCAENPARFRRVPRRRARHESGATDVLSDLEKEYIRLHRDECAALYRLFDHEEDKIRSALDKLREHLVAAGCTVAGSA
jgi:hypothetical protein